MTNRYKSVFDIIGPVMVGPSSSHTAGAVAIGRAGYKLFGGTPSKVTVHYYDSFAQTHRGHGTDYAIAAGILGFDSDDLRVPKAPEIARQRGVDLRFVEEDGPSPIGHPNTAILNMSNDKKKVELAGCSIGGGAIEIRQMVIDQITVKPAGPLPIIVYVDYGKKHPNAVELTSYIDQVAPFSRKQSLKGDVDDIYEYDIKNYMTEETIKDIQAKFNHVICL